MSKFSISFAELVNVIGFNQFCKRDLYRAFPRLNTTILDNFLASLLSKNKIYLKNGKFCLLLKKSKLTYQVVKEKSFFLVCSKKTKYQLYKNDIKLVFLGDLVKCNIIEDLNLAKIVDIEKRYFKEIWGYCYKFRNKFYLKYLDHKLTYLDNIIILNGCSRHIDLIVKIKIVNYPTKNTLPSGNIIQSTDKINSQISFDIVKNEYNLSDEYSKQSIKQINLDKDDKKILKDCTKIPFITIDGQYTQDIDDAVFAEFKENTYNLKVAIADVSYYVKQDTTLDKEAYLKGNSYYFPGHTIHMLPSKLSQELCSLEENRKKRALICDIVLSKKGKIISYSFYEAYILSKIRATYDQVNLFLQDELKLEKQISNSLKTLKNIRDVLYHNRSLNGCLSFNTYEPTIMLDELGFVSDIICFAPTMAHSIIEECMILANRCAAIFISKNSTYGLYRIHESPSNAVKATVVQAATLFGVKTNFQGLLKMCSSSALVCSLVLKNIGRAVYSTVNKGHFGLSLTSYAHFTSPIRRFADLIVHRMIKAILNKSDLKYTKKYLDEICCHISYTGRIADKASRRANDILISNFISKNSNEYMLGVITCLLTYHAYVFVFKYTHEGILKVNRKLSLGDKLLVKFSRLSQDFKIILELVEVIK